jgi:hypothetical protein
MEGMHVLDITRDPDVGGGQGLVVLDVESDADLTGCPDCGIIAVGHGRHVQVLHDAPCFGTPVRVRWRKRIWRCCPEPSRDLDRGARLRSAASQAHQPGGGVEVSLLRLDDTTVSAIARLLDAVRGRSGAVYADWLEEQGVEVTMSVEYAALNPFRGYRNASLERRHRSHQRRHREDPPTRPRLPQLHQLQDPDPAHRRRHPPLPASADQDSISRTSRPRLIYEEPPKRIRKAEVGRNAVGTRRPSVMSFP